MAGSCALKLMEAARMQGPAPRIPTSLGLGRHHHDLAVNRSGLGLGVERGQLAQRHASSDGDLEVAAVDEGDEGRKRLQPRRGRGCAGSPSR